jgi:hypothetical protein
MALGDITLYSKDNGFGYPGEIDYVVGTAATVPTILSGELVNKVAGTSLVTAQASGTAAVNYPQIPTGPNSVPVVGVAASTSTEGTSGFNTGKVSVISIEAPVTWLVSTLITSSYFGQPSSGVATQQKQYDSMVGSRVAMNRVGGAGASMLGGTYSITATDATGNGLIVEALDIAKFPGKVRFSFRNALSAYN